MTKGTKVVYTVGTGINKHGQSISRSFAAHALSLAKTEAATTFGGFTLRPVEGGWIDGEGKYIAETSAQFEIIVSDDKLPFVESFAVYLRLAFEQASVLITVQNIAFEFVESGEVSSVRA